LPLTLALASLAAAAGCGSGNDRAAVEQVVSDISSYTGKDVDAFMDRVTDAYLRSSNLTREDCAANPEVCVGEPTSVQFKSVDVTGDRAIVDGAFTSSSRNVELRLLLVKVNGAWKLDGVQTVSGASP
jgi:hypothetical protein